MAEGLSVALPLSMDTVDGAYALNKSMRRMAEQNLKMVLLTSPGERVMQPDFGVGIRNYLFEQNARGLTAGLKQRIQNQVTKYLPYMIITDLKVFSPTMVEYGPNVTDNTRLNVLISYAVPTLSISSTFAIAVEA